MVDTGNGEPGRAPVSCCPLCGGTENRLLYPATTTAGGTTPQASSFCCTSHDLARHPDIVECASCGLLRNDPLPAPQQVLTAYQQVEDPTYLEEATGRVLTFSCSLAQLHRLARPPGRLLDIGCYTGVFLEVAAAAGWQVEGLELSTWAAAIARDRALGPIHEVPLDQADLAAATFEVVTLWDVIEHLADPLAMLRGAHRLLRPGGVVALSTHLVDSLAPRLLGTRYPFFMEMHLVHLHRRSLRMLLDQAGFTQPILRPHHRVLRLGYLLDKLHHRLPNAAARRLAGWLARRRWLAERHLRVGLLGLANIFAYKR